MSLLTDFLALFTPATMPTSANDASAAWGAAHAGAHETLLASVTLHTQITTKQTIYTVPVAKSLILTGIFVRAGGTAPTGDGAGTAGGNANADDSGLGCYYPQSLATMGCALLGATGNNSLPVHPAGTVIGWKGSADTTNTTVTADLFGYLV